MCFTHTSALSSTSTLCTGKDCVFVSSPSHARLGARCQRKALDQSLQIVLQFQRADAEHTQLDDASADNDHRHY